MNYKEYLILPILTIVFSIGCEDRSDLTAPEAPLTGTADFSKFFSLGNSLTAGYQSGALYESSQNYSYGKMIANQIGIKYVQPTISDPGIGGRIETATVSPFSTYTQPEDAGRPINLTYAGIYNNLGIPGALLPDLLQANNTATALDKTNVFFDIVLRGQGTLLELAIASQPSLLTLWIGNNDILGYATSGGLLPHTPTETFAFLYDQLCDTLASANIPVVLANIPNVRDIPYFITVAPSVGLAIQAAKAQNPLIQDLVYQTTDAPFIGVAPVNDLLNNKILLTLPSSSAVEFIGDQTGAYYSTTGANIPSNVNTQFPFGLTSENPFPNGFVVDQDEQVIIENVTSSFNSTIRNVSAKYGYHLADMNSVFNDIATNGLVVEGVNYTTDYVSGGFFSLDGVHPTSQGYAIIANEFIKVINGKFSAKIPLVKVTTIPGSLELKKRVEFNKFGLPLFEIGTFNSNFY